MNILYKGITSESLLALILFIGALLVILSCLSLHQLPQSLVTINYVILDIVATDGTEVLAGAVGFGIFSLAKILGGGRTLCFGDKVDMLHPVFIEGKRPVRLGGLGAVSALSFWIKLVGASNSVE